MAKIQLKAGAEVDFLTEEELGNRLDDFQRRLLRDLEPDTLVRPAGTIKLDGSGNGSGTLYLVPVGYKAKIHRLMIDYPGSSAAATVTCDVRVIVDNDASSPSALRIITNTLPNVYEVGTRDAPVFLGGQRATLVITGGPVSKVISATVQLDLYKIRDHK